MGGEWCCRVVWEEGGHLNMRVKEIGEKTGKENEFYAIINDLIHVWTKGLCTIVQSLVSNFDNQQCYFNILVEASTLNVNLTHN